MFYNWCQAKKKYKQRSRTPLLFLTGRSPEVIFPLPWNKSMKRNSLWTITHLLKSDVGWGASHHRTYSVCWQRGTLRNKPCSLKQVPEHEFGFWEAKFRKTQLIRECLLFCMQPFGLLTWSHRVFQCKQDKGLFFSAFKSYMDICRIFVSSVLLFVMLIQMYQTINQISPSCSCSLANVAPQWLH